ncbi:MAG: sigma factor-like helix-turn-helix DNA-binding protein [Bacteroidales bacterium]|nr:sigma factor-like helix-turn-helix DNA-binding protein [Bacteroidales bacterium]
MDREPAILLDKWLSCKSDKDALIVFLNHPSIKKLRDKAIAGKYKAGYKSDAQQIAYLCMLECINELADKDSNTIIEHLNSSRFYFAIVHAILYANGCQKINGRWRKPQTTTLHWAKNELTYTMDDAVDEVNRANGDYDGLFNPKLARAIDELSPVEKSIVAMRYEQNMTTGEIAIKLNMSRRNVQKKMYGTYKRGKYIEGIIDKLRKNLKPS